MTIRTKLVLWYSGLLIVIILFFGAALYGVMRYTLISSIDSTLQETASEVLRNSRAVLVPEFGSPSRVFIRLPELDIFRASGVVVQVWEIVPPEEGSPSGLRLAGASANLQGYTNPLDSAALDQERIWISSESPSSDIYSHIRVGGEWRVLTRPYEIWGVRRIIVQTATPIDTVNQASRGLLVVLLLSSFFALLGSVALGLGLADRALKPIAMITESARKVVSADDLKKRLKWSGPMDELGSLTAVLNQMLARLEHLFSVQQRFVADMSHELRTPLTAIRGHLDLIKRYGMDADSMEAIESESARMARLVSDLLLLARADYGGLTLERMDFNLDDLLMEAHRDAIALAKDRDLKIKVGEVDEVAIHADPDRIKQLLLNLVGNAIKFTPDGGRITLELHQRRKDDGAYAVIDIQDTGIGIAPADLPRIFDRFYQADSSRARHDLNEGVGLGLSIARWIAEAHGGRIEVESAPGVGSLFSVYLPIVETGSSDEQNTRVSNNAITRPRLSIMRRSGSRHD
jgi:signal transduction histidine kinase